MLAEPTAPAPPHLVSRAWYGKQPASRPWFGESAVAWRAASGHLPYRHTHPPLPFPSSAPALAYAATGHNSSVPRPQLPPWPMMTTVGKRIMLAAGEKKFKSHAPHFSPPPIHALRNYGGWASRASRRLCTSSTDRPTGEGGARQGLQRPNLARPRSRPRRRRLDLRRRGPGSSGPVPLR